MSTLGNQFIIKIDYDNEWCEYENLMEACRYLNGAALKLYLYLSAYGAGEEIVFFPSNFHALTGVSLSAEKKAFAELITNHYLVEKEKNYFLFSSIKK